MSVPSASWITASRRLTLGAFVLLVSVLAIAWAYPAKMGKLQFIALINSGQENPAGTSGAFGVAHMSLADNGVLTYSISFDGLSAAETAAHFHGPAEPGVNAAVLFPLPLGNPKNGTIGPLTSQQLSDLTTGRLYINIHTTTVPAGEIRGQVLPVP